MGKSLYFILLLITIAGPIGLSFTKKQAFYKSWFAAFPALILSAIPFLIWDVFFAYKGIWGFNPMYISGLHIINLPIEEVLFFLIIPYACLFIYASIRFHFPKLKTPLLLPTIFFVSGFVLIFIGLFFISKPYTCIAFMFSGILCAIASFSAKDLLLHFSIAFLISVIPFMIVNGILTGMITPEPVVWYNNESNMNIRFGTIPLEDFFYNLSLLLLNILLFERLKSFQSTKKLSNIAH